MPIILEYIKEGAAPVFCGVVKKSIAGKEKGQSCLYIEAETASSLLDQKKRNRSFQRQGRSYQELIGEISRAILYGKKVQAENSRVAFYSNMKKPIGN